MIDPAITNYNQSQEGNNKEICEYLTQFINANISDTTNKLWHGGPVWFINDNPIVGYWVRKQGVTLLFWSGQSFNEPGLQNEGKFKAAQIEYMDISQINGKNLKRWLTKAETIQWDYKNIIKNKGQLSRLQVS